MAENDSSVGLRGRRPCTRRLDCLPRAGELALLPRVFKNALSSYAAVDGELHADDYTGVRSAAGLLYT